MLRRVKTWWSAPCGGREVLLLALPLVISQGFGSLQLFIDRTMLFWFDETAMAAALPSSMLHWTLISFPLGVVSFVNTFVAQYCGAGHPERVGRVVRQGLVVGLVLTPLFLLCIPAAPWLFNSADHGAEFTRQEIIYFQTLAWGGGALVMHSALSAFFTGRGQMLIVMLANLVATLTNGVLDYALIFGEWGFPRLGIAGAAWATVAANFLNAAILFAWMQRRELRETFELWQGKFVDFPLLGRLLYYGVPGALPMVVETASFTLLCFFIASIGEQATAATTLALNVNMVAFIPLFGLSIAISTLVGTQLGANRDDLAARATWNGQLLGWAYTSLFALGYLFTPDWFLVAHTLHGNQTQFAELREIVVVLLRFVAAYAFLDATQIVFVSALRGAGDTRFILLATSGVASICIAIGRYAQVHWGTGLFGWWWVLTAWITALAIIYSWRFLQGKWRTMRVIEPNLLDLEPIRLAHLDGAEAEVAEPLSR